MIKKTLQCISKKEWITFFIISTLILILANMVYVYGFFAQPKNAIYNGLHPQSPSDIPVYYSYIQQVKDGSMVFYDLFTPEDQAFGVINILWLFVGLFAKVFYLSPIFAFHVARLLLSPLLLVVIYVFIAYFFHTSKERITAFLLTLGSGIGGYAALFLQPAQYTMHGFGYRWPIDLWAITHAYIFTALNQSPHFIVSIMLQVLILFFALLAWQENKIRYSMASGLIAFMLFNFHPYHALSIFTTLGLFYLIMFLKRSEMFFSRIHHGIIIVITSLPSLVYHFWILKSNWVLALRASQNITLLPPFFYVILGYGFLFLLSFVGIFFLIQKKQFDSGKIFIIAWFFSHLILIFPKIPFQSKLLQGWVVPMGILSTYAVFKLFGNTVQGLIKPRASVLPYTIVLLLYIFLFFFSNLLNITRDYMYLKQYPDFFYIQDDFSKALAWMKENIPQDKIILSTIDSGLFIAGFATRRVYVGHGHETLFKEQRKILSESFFSSFSQRTQKKFLLENPIDYIFVGPYEKSLLKEGFGNKSFASLIFQNEKVSIYKVVSL